MYEYEGVITYVYDGDTLTADIDLGFQTWLKKVKLRLKGVDTPEIRTRDANEKLRAIVARDRVRELCYDKKVKIVSREKGKYGRWLADVNIDGHDLADLLTQEGLAAPYGSK